MAESMNISKKFKIDKVKAVLIIIILALAGYIGWSAWNDHHRTQAAINNAKNSSNQAAKKAQSQIPTVNNKTYIFKELGVQISLPGALQGMIYTSSELPGPNNSKTTVLNLTTPQLVAEAASCTHKQPEGSSAGSFASLSRNDGKYPTGPTASGAGDLMKQFDDFYVIARYPNPANCVSATDAVNLQNDQKADQKALKDAFKNAQIYSNAPPS